MAASSSYAAETMPGVQADSLGRAPTAGGKAGQVIDRLFKAALLTVLLAFLYIAWLMKDNGRYVYHPENEHSVSQMVIDSRTGAVFFFIIGKGTIEVHPKTGEQINHRIQK